MQGLLVIIIKVLRASWRNVSFCCGQVLVVVVVVVVVVVAVGHRYEKYLICNLERLSCETWSKLSVEAGEVNRFGEPTVVSKSGAKSESCEESHCVVAMYLDLSEFLFHGACCRNHHTTGNMFVAAISSRTRNLPLIGHVNLPDTNFWLGFF